MTVAVKIQVPEKVDYVLHVKTERRDKFDARSWNLSGSYEFPPGTDTTLWVSRDSRIVRMEEVPIDKVAPLPASSRQSITIDEDAHGG